MAFAWDALILSLDMWGRTDILRGFLLSEWEFVMTPTFQLVIFLVAAFLLLSKTNSYRHRREAIKSWIEGKPPMLTITLFLGIGLVAGGILWTWFKYGPEPETRLAPYKLAQTTDNDLKTYTDNLSKRIRSEYERFEQEWESVDNDAVTRSRAAARPIEKNDIERLRQEKHREAGLKFEKKFQRLYLEDAASAEREIIARLGKIRISGDVSINLGPGGGIGAVNLPPRPTELIIGRVSSPSYRLPDYLDRLAALL